MPHPTGGYKIDGKRVPGVTTILGRFKESGGLIRWAYEQGKKAERGEINDLYDSRDAAADAGTLAHAMVEAHNNFGPMPEQKDYPEEIWKQASQGYENYLNWEDNTKIVIVYQEVELVSKSFLYGGCLDAIGRDTKGKLCMIDWKTSNGVYQDYLCQESAYGNLWNENHPNEPLTGGYHLCRFAKEHADFTHHFWSELDDAWELFKLYRKAYDLDKSLKKRV